MKKPASHLLLSLGALVLSVACSSSTGGGDASMAPGDAAVLTGDGSLSTVDGGNDDLGPACTGTTSICTTYNTRQFCMNGGMQTEVCPQGCYQGACSTTQCSDECVLGSTSAEGTCQLWSMGSQSFVTPAVATSLHDRARGYDQVLRNQLLPEGEVMNGFFTDATLKTIKYYTGSTDSAIWTGTALAAESWRYLVTGEPDALAAVETMAETIHRGFVITGDVAYLARVSRLASGVTPLGSLGETGPPMYTDCSAAGIAAGWHCGVMYQGQSYNWLGQTSRDAYTGAMLGYATAYRALAGVNEPLRKIIRQDVVTFATQLTTPQTVHATVTVESSLPTISFKKTMTLTNVILAPSEMVGGQVIINVDTSNAGGATMVGLRDFLPDYGPVMQQLIGVGTSIPKASSAMMVGGFIDMALMMSADDPTMAAQHQALLTYYNANVANLLSIADQWSFSADCGSGYFANHIAFIMAYTWALLETNPTLKPQIAVTMFNNTMWSALKGHKNSYFAFLWGGTQDAPDAADIMTAVTEFTQFEPAPRVETALNLEGNPMYPADPTCGADFCNTATNAVEVGQRRVQDFLWQRDPWELTDPGQAETVFPGVDYLAAYWAGRYHKFLNEDDTGSCNRFGPTQ